MKMRYRMHGCGPRGRRDIPEAIIALAAGRGGWGGGFGPGGGGFGGDWGQWTGGGGGRHGRGGPRRGMFKPGELRLVLLKLISDQPRHGYDLIQSIETMTHGSYAPSPGVVYPTLTMLQDMGLIEERATEGTRKAFAVTAEGTAHLEERQEEVEALIARLNEHGEQERRAGGGAPISRAVGNLLSALWHRVQREGMDEATLHKIADILDEAAKKVERM
jgi:DNA-binding PadR family transcriptional regulator